MPRHTAASRATRRRCSNRWYRFLSPHPRRRRAMVRPECPPSDTRDSVVATDGALVSGVRLQVSVEAAFDTVVVARIVVGDVEHERDIAVCVRRGVCRLRGRAVERAGGGVGVVVRRVGSAVSSSYKVVWSAASGTEPCAYGATTIDPPENVAIPIRTAEANEISEVPLKPSKFVVMGACCARRGFAATSAIAASHGTRGRILQYNIHEAGRAGRPAPLASTVRCRRSRPRPGCRCSPPGTR